MARETRHGWPWTSRTLVCVSSIIRMWTLDTTRRNPVCKPPLTRHFREALTLSVLPLLLAWDPGRTVQAATADLEARVDAYLDPLTGG